MRIVTAITILLALPALAQDKPVLTVLTYDSFVSEWGPGPIVETAFEAECGCDLRFVTGGDGAALLARLTLEGEGSETDVVLGLDSNLVEQGRTSGLFGKHRVDSAVLQLPVTWSDDIFLPFDWGWFSLVGRVGGPRPGSFLELAESEATLVIQDPRSSTPGLGLVLWIEAAYGEEAPAVWEASPRGRSPASGESSTAATTAVSSPEGSGGMTTSVRRSCSRRGRWVRGVKRL